MTPEEHYREAERMVAQLTDLEFMKEATGDLDDMEDVRALIASNIAVAQVHATLALYDGGAE